MREKLTTKYTEWKYVEGLSGWEKNAFKIKAYRLWLETNGRSWWQRHEWLYENGTQCKDDWIDAALKKFPDHYIEIKEQDKE